MYLPFQDQFSNAIFSQLLVPLNLSTNQEKLVMVSHLIGLFSAHNIFFKRVLKCEETWCPLWCSGLFLRQQAGRLQGLVQGGNPWTAGIQWGEGILLLPFKGKFFILVMSTIYNHSSGGYFAPSCKAGVYILFHYRGGNAFFFIIPGHIIWWKIGPPNQATHLWTK